MQIASTCDIKYLPIQHSGFGGMWQKGLRFLLLIFNAANVVAFEDSDVAELKKRLEILTLNAVRFGFCIYFHSSLTLIA